MLLPMPYGTRVEWELSKYGNTFELKCKNKDL
jgi:hypothetical protein